MLLLLSCSGVESVLPRENVETGALLASGLARLLLAFV
jgi:hypothetical protein